jgi:hypothetical protein
MWRMDLACVARDPVARAMGNPIEKLNRIGVRMEEIEERQDCLEDKVSEHPPPTPDRILTLEKLICRAHR